MSEAKRVDAVRGPDLSPLARALIDSLSGGRAAGAAVRGLDPRIETRLVRLVSTSLYGLPERAGSARDAVARLGVRTVQRLVLAIELLDAYARPEHDVERGALRRTWLMQAVAARRLAVEKGEWDPDQAFLAGLLADCGALDLLERLPDYRDLLIRHYSGEGDLLDLERAAFGGDHEPSTQRLLARWGIEPAVRDAVASRPAALRGGGSAPARILAGATLLARAQTVGGFVAEGDRVERRLVELLGLSPGLAASIAAGLRGELRQVIDALEAEPLARAERERWPDPTELSIEVDAITGLVEPGAFARLIELFHGRAAQLRRPLALLVLEIDSIKALRDSEGRDALARFADLVTGLVRRTDVNARLPDGQVAVLAVGCGAGDMPRIAERLRSGVEGAQLGAEPEAGPQLVIGMSATDPHHDASDPRSLLASAYTALSRAELAPDRTFAIS